MDTIDSPDILYKFLRDSGMRVLSNMIFAGSPGHQISELDYFIRKFHCGAIPQNGRYLWVQRAGAITETMAEVYGTHFRQFNLGMVANDQLFSFASQITRMVPEYGIDVGLSHVKNSVLSRQDTYVAPLQGELYYNVTNHAVVQAYMDYFRLQNLSLEFDPWTPARPTIDGPLAEFLGGNIDRLALIHFRQRAGNAGIPIPPESLFSSIEYLKDIGMTVVKVGTEACPEEFKRFDVINYSESPFRTFRNDLALLSHARIALINSSGLENLADLTRIPTVSYGRWHLSLPLISKRTVVVPALLFDPTRKRMLTFAEQILFFKTRQEFWEGAFFGWHFPLDRFIARVPQDDEMRAATEEALAMVDSDSALSPEQNRFNQLDEYGLLSLAKSRVSQFFLERFEPLL